MKTRWKNWLAVGAGTLALLVLPVGCQSGDAGWSGLLSAALGSGSGPLSLETIVAGLKEALAVGTQNAVAQTGKTGGYARDPLIRVPLPEQLQGPAKALRAVGLGSLVDNLEAKMNEGAEQAAAQAAPIFIGAIRQMTFADARQILEGADTAATDYFREKTGPQLADLYRPVVSKNLEQVGAAKAYGDLIGRYNALPLVPKVQFSLDEYVTRKGVDGLFTVLAGEERKIRADPAARTTELLRRVFGG
jgi:hypothetical protein